MTIIPPARTHGGKSRIKNWLFKNFPPPSSYSTFIDLFGGGGSITLNIKKTLKNQIYNDYDRKLYNFMFQLKNNLCEFIRIVKDIECSKENFEKYKKIHDEININQNYLSCEQAVATYLTKRMSRGGLGKDFSESTRLRGGRNECVNCWENSKKNLMKVSDRLQTVDLFNFDFADLIEEFRGSYLNHSVIEEKSVFIYADPPYVKSTRTSKEIYDNEMPDEDHVRLAKILNRTEAKVAISGYESLLYKELYPTSKWRMVKKEVANNSGQNKKKQKRIECLWMNY